jgi:hypothetical protein
MKPRPPTLALCETGAHATFLYEKARFVKLTALPIF